MAKKATPKIELTPEQKDAATRRVLEAMAKTKRERATHLEMQNYTAVADCDRVLSDLDAVKAEAIENGDWVIVPSSEV